MVEWSKASGLYPPHPLPLTIAEVLEIPLLVVMLPLPSPLRVWANWSALQLTQHLGGHLSSTLQLSSLASSLVSITCGQAPVVATAMNSFY